MTTSALKGLSSTRLRPTILFTSKDLIKIQKI